MTAIASKEYPTILRMDEVISILRLSRPTAYKLALRPDFPALRFGKAIRIPRDQFFAWLEVYQAEQMAAARGEAGAPE